MKSFSKLHSDFWINYDNSEVISLGIDAQLMALYLQGNSHRNILGVYYLPLLYIASDLKIPVEQVKVILEKLCKINYCKYDERTQHVWIYNLAFEQIGENVDIKDNRIKALHAIWVSLPSKLEFLEEIYQRYSVAFYLEPRIFEMAVKACKIKETKKIEEIEGIRKTKSDTAVADVSLGISANTNINVKDIAASTHTVTATNSNVNTDIQPTIESLPVPMSPFEAPSESFDSPDEVGNRDDIFENSPLIPPSELPEVFLEDFCADKISSDVPIICNAMLDSEDSERSRTTLTPSKSIAPPFGGASKPLARPFEGALDPLRSNIEDRSKIIEVRSKKEEIEEELEKEKIRDINKNRVLTTDIVAHKKNARLCVVEELPNRISLEEAKEISLAQDSGNFLITPTSSSLEQKIDLKPKTKLKVKKDVDDSVALVFEHWKSVMQHPRSNLDRKREVLINKALQLGYGAQQLCDAVTGCSYTPHNIGHNERGQRYDGLHVILRDADQIDRFIYNCHHPPKSFTDADHRLQANKQVATDWIKKKLEESSFLDARRNRYA